MELSYKARYYNGQSSKPYVVDFSMSDDHIAISYNDELAAYHQIVWNKHHIIESDFTSAQIILRYGEQFPYQQLEITDQQFIKQYRQHFKSNIIRNWLHFSSFGMIGLLLTGFVVTIVLGYFFALPLVADHFADTFPVEYEIALGEKMYAQILNDSKVDTVKTEAINRFFKTLHTDGHYPVKITVVKDSVVNAFAIPGGGIIVYDAILNTMKTPEELAALLSHEYSHVTLKHATRNVFRSVAGYLFISVIFSDVNGIANLVINNANQLQNLSYSRELEHEADENGLQILKANRISSSGMIDLFESLKEHNQIHVEELVSTHPDIDNRIAFVKEFAKENPYKTKPTDSLAFYFNQLK